MIDVEITTLVGSCILFIVWLAKLEFGTAQNRKDIEILQKKHDALEKEIVNKLSLIEKSLARVEGKLSK